MPVPAASHGAKPRSPRGHAIEQFALKQEHLPFRYTPHSLRGRKRAEGILNPLLPFEQTYWPSGSLPGLS